MTVDPDRLLWRRRSLLGWTAALGAALITRPALALAREIDSGWRRLGDLPIEGDPAEAYMISIMLKTTGWENALVQNARSISLNPS